MGHHDSFNVRNNKSGNISENKCKEFLKSKSILYTRYGFDALFDIPGYKFSMIPEVLKCTPDYMVFNKIASLLEVKGCSDVLRLKLLDMKAYDWWENIVPLSMFLHSSTYKEHKILKYKDLKKIAITCETDRYHDNNKEYYKIPWKRLGEKND